MLSEKDLAYADDLDTISITKEEHTRKMDIVSAFCTFTGLLPAAHKIQSFFMQMGQIPILLPLPIRNYSWVPVPSDISKPIDSKYLGVRVPLTLGPIVNDPAARDEAIRLRGLLKRIQTKHAPPLEE
jgi:hypothetical protein